MNALRKHIQEVSEQLESIEPLGPGSIFVQLQDKLGNAPYGWAVYDEQGSLLAWKGQFPAREIRILPESEELTVYTELHQQFLRLKRVSAAKQITFIIVVNTPIAADYGIQNQYLRNYNLLTDQLTIRPDLLYNSQVTTPSSSDLIVRTFEVAPEFSVTVLFKKAHYQEFLANQNFRLHWWFELVALLYVLFGVIYSFFDFIGISGQEVPVRKLWRSWFVIIVLSLFGLLLISEFSAFGSSRLFFEGHGSFDVVVSNQFARRIVDHIILNAERRGKSRRFTVEDQTGPFERK